MAGGTGGSAGTEPGGLGASVTSTGAAGPAGTGQGVVTVGIAYASGGGGGSAGGTGGGSRGGGAGGVGGAAMATGSSATGGAGGAGGANGAVLAVSGLTNSTSYGGGYGGSGSQGQVTGTGVAGGGGGGEGGYGLILTASSGITSFTNTAQYVTGGYGGYGGRGAGGGAAGVSGDGGVGLYVAAPGITLTNTGGLYGGNPNDATGKNGVGLLAGSGLTLIDSGNIQGGSGYGAATADAIAFTGGANTIALSASNLLSGGISVASGASLTFNQAAGPFTNSLTLSNGIEGGGSIIKNDNTVLDLTGASTYTGGTTIAAGTLALGQAASAGTGAVTFGSAATTLELDFAGTTANPDVLQAPVSGFVVGDKIDLTAIASTATASYASGVLTVSDGTNSDQITIGQAPTGDRYVVSNDGNGHALVTLAVIPTPTITGTHATTDAAEAAVTPFGASATSPAVTVNDPNAGATDSATITLSGGGGMLSGTGLTQNADGSYTLTASAAAAQAAGSSSAALSQELDALSFTPTNATPGATTTTTFQIAVTSSAGSSATDVGTQVIDTAAAAPVTPTPTPTPAPNPTPTPAPTPNPIPVAPDTVAISPVVTYRDGVFNLTGTASSPAGVREVEITAQVDGAATDLGAATVDANGTFTFKDAIGASLQGFITATETNGAGGTASAQADYSLQGGLDQPNAGRAPFVAEQDVYNADGSATTSVSLFRGDGSTTNDASRRTTVMAPGQTFTSDQFDDFKNGGMPETTFVFNPNHGLDTIDLFRPDNVDHDTLSFSGADFGNSIANLLNDTHQTKGGSSIIADPVTGDTVKLVGVTKQTLTTYAQQDITFHA